MTMPGITGDQLSKAVKRIRPDMPVFMGTGYNEKMTSENAREIGIDRFMMKPVTMIALANLLSKLFGGGRHRKRNPSNDSV
jgi:DNA-binding NtrC family response regulator